MDLFAAKTSCTHHSLPVPHHFQKYQKYPLDKNEFKKKTFENIF